MAYAPIKTRKRGSSILASARQEWAQELEQRDSTEHPDDDGEPDQSPPIRAPNPGQLVRGACHSDVRSVIGCSVARRRQTSYRGGEILDPFKPGVRRRRYR
jgi:hypothetical protein